MMVSQFDLIVPIWYYILYIVKVYEILMQPAIKIISWLKKKATKRNNNNFHQYINNDNNNNNFPKICTNQIKNNIYI